MSHKHILNIFVIYICLKHIWVINIYQTYMFMCLPSVHNYVVFYLLKILKTFIECRSCKLIFMVDEEIFFISLCVLFSIKPECCIWYKREDMLLWQIEELEQRKFDSLWYPKVHCDVYNFTSHCDLEKFSWNNGWNFSNWALVWLCFKYFSYHTMKHFVLCTEYPDWIVLIGRLRDRYLSV